MDHTAPLGPPAADAVGGFDISAVSAPIKIPCTMLARDLASVGLEAWVSRGSSMHLTAPKGSVVLVHDGQAPAIVERLRSSTPRALQILVMMSWLKERGHCEPTPTEIAAGIGAGATRGVATSEVARTLEDLCHLEFLSGPVSEASDRQVPGPPVVALPGGRYQLAETWTALMTGRRQQVAKIPERFLAMHAKNDRYQILIAWHLSIMLRINRKHGYYYRVSLRKLLHGCGIDIPRRNVGRFLTAVQRALQEIEGVGSVGPDPSGKPHDEVLDSIHAFWLEPAAVAQYAPTGG